jgi:hypothetical protein
MRIKQTENNEDHADLRDLRQSDIEALRELLSLQHPCHLVDYHRQAYDAMVDEELVTPESHAVYRDIEAFFERMAGLNTLI